MVQLRLISRQNFWSALTAVFLCAASAGAAGRTDLGGLSSGQEISGRTELAAGEIRVGPDAPYAGRFDLTGAWGAPPRVTLTRGVITFRFQDNDVWRRTERRGLPQKSGPSRRFMADSLFGGARPALEESYVQEVVSHFSNPEEVARLRIGADMFFAASSRRRFDRVEDGGAARSFMGLHENHATGETFAIYQVTQRRLREEWDGYADSFAIRQKTLGLDALRDLAEDGILPFILDGEGDYLLVGASLDYQGYALPGFAGPDREKDAGGAYGYVLAALGLLGGLGLFVAVRRTPERTQKSFRRSARRVLSPR